jgi:RNA polymerase sigma-70 factor, ECF subfamily
MTSPAAAVAATHETDNDVRAAQGGDRQAFERLYRLHANRVFAVCVRMTGDRHQAEELTQDAFVRAWDKLPQFRGDAQFGTWLHRLAVNVVLNARAGSARTIAREAEDSAAALDVAPQPAAPAGLSLDLEQAIAGLPTGARRVFTLFDVYGYSHEEIADQLGITTGGSKAQLHRARMLLREALSR